MRTLVLAVAALFSRPAVPVRHPAACGRHQFLGKRESKRRSSPTPRAFPRPAHSVLLIPSGFNPARDQLAKNAHGDTTDASGSYAFTEVAPGTYNIEATNLAHGTSLLITGIALAKKDSLTVSQDTLRKPGTVVVALAGTADSLGGQVYIPGTTLLQNVSAHAQSVTLDSVPHGAIPSVVFEQTGAAAPVVIGSNVNVPPSDTAFVSNSAKIIINTSPTGANVTAMVTHFPLLVRLDSTFAFGQARLRRIGYPFCKAGRNATPFPDCTMGPCRQAGRCMGVG